LSQAKPNREKPRNGAAEVGWSGDIGAKWRSRHVEWVLANHTVFRNKSSKKQKMKSAKRKMARREALHE
jgi:hypothetical protein